MLCSLWEVGFIGHNKLCSPSQFHRRKCLSFCVRSFLCAKEASCHRALFSVLQNPSRQRTYCRQMLKSSELLVPSRPHLSCQCWITSATGSEQEGWVNLPPFSVWYWRANNCIVTFLNVFTSVWIMLVDSVRKIPDILEENFFSFCDRPIDRTISWLLENQGLNLTTGAGYDEEKNCHHCVFEHFVLYFNGTQGKMLSSDEVSFTS